MNYKNREDMLRAMRPCYLRSPVHSTRLQRSRLYTIGVRSWSRVFQHRVLCGRENLTNSAFIPPAKPRGGSTVTSRTGGYCSSVRHSPRPIQKMDKQHLVLTSPNGPGGVSVNVLKAMACKGFTLCSPAENIQTANCMECSRLSPDAV